MLRTRRLLAVCSVLGWLAAAGYAADPWTGSQIMPKSDQLTLRCEVDGAPVGNAYQIEWPATVERVEGQWLRIADQSGYGIPSVSGWVSKEDVLKLDEAHDHYARILRTADAPWAHWMIGIYLQSKKEPRSARRAYLECLKLAPDAPDAAVQAAVERNPGLLDAAVRLARLDAVQTKSAREVAAAADAIRGLSETAARAGIRRPQLAFEYAETLRRAYHLNWSNKDATDLRSTPATAGQTLFERAEDAYQALVSPDSGSVHADPCGWRGHLGKAELYMDRAAMFQDQVTSLLSRPGEDAGSPTSKQAADATASAVTASDANGLDTIQTQIDLKTLHGFVDALKDPKSAPRAVERANTAMAALAAGIQSLHTAVDCFDEAIRRGPGVIEAYRDRSLAYLMLARSEAVLATIADANPKLRDSFNGLPHELALSLRTLDRALVAGRTQFDGTVVKLHKAQDDLARVSEEQKDLADAEEELARRYLTVAVSRGDAGGKAVNKAATPKGYAAGQTTDLPAIRQKLRQLRAEADAMAAEADGEKREAEIRGRLRDANAALAKSYDVLNKSENLSRARGSAHAACDLGNYANAESLKLLAAVYASQCNFDRAEYYQKLAVIFTSEDDRPNVLATLDEYRKMGELVLPRAHAKTPGVPAAQAGRSKASSDGAASD